MQVVCVQSWAEFEERIINRFSQDDLRRPVYRGHGNADWRLETTLERQTPRKLPLSDYHKMIGMAQKAIESCTSRKWDLPGHNTFCHGLDDPVFSGLFIPPGYEFLAYLRHHGFPSPLLDWTESPYVAAYFAFESPDVKTKDVAIFEYTEFGRGGKPTTAHKPKILSLGPSISTHRRHFLQQSQYTICLEERKSHLFYTCHEDVFAEGEADQDILVKYLLPVSLRSQVLEKLDYMNINAFSLFGTEEALMRTLSIREFTIGRGTPANK